MGSSDYYMYGSECVVQPFPFSCSPPQNVIKAKQITAFGRGCGDGGPASARWPFTCQKGGREDWRRKVSKSGWK